MDCRKFLETKKSQRKSWCFEAKVRRTSFWRFRRWS